MQADKMRRIDDEENEIDLSEYIGLLHENRYLIASVTFLFFLVGLVYSISSTPIFRADALLQIEQGKRGFAGRDELAMMMGQGESSSSTTEIELLKSRSLLGDVVESVGLTISVSAKRFPLIGGYLAAKYSGAAPANAWLGFSSYAWGGERFNIPRLDVSGAYLGQNFILTAGEEGQYQLSTVDGEIVLDGKVGQPASIDNGSVAIFVAELGAGTGTEFYLSKSSTASVIASLQSSLRIVEKGRATGLLQVVLDGSNREQIRKTINGLTQSYLRRSVEMRSEESEKMLSFINEQLPVMRADLDTAGRSLNFYREKVGAIDLSMESSSLLQRLSKAETEISVLGIERAELKHRLTDNHPVILDLDEKRSRLQKQVADLESQLKTVPEKELEYVKLSRDVKVASELYMLLLNKSQELKLTKAGTLGNVRIVDEAVAGVHAIKPNKPRIVMLSILLGVIVGVMIAVIRKALNKTIQDPSVIEKQIGSPIYAEIAFSEFQAEATKTKKKNLDLLAHVGGDTQVVESLRSLRTSIQFALMEADNNLVMITSPSPGVGKSFVSANFAYLMADSEKKILLIDADMRKGHLNQYFNVEKSPGLSEILSGEFELSQVIHKDTLEKGLDMMATGIYPPNPSELLMSDAFKTLLDKLKGLYDLIIIDTPPVLAVTDAAIIGQYAATNFMVLRSGWHHLREVQVAFKRFEHNGVKIKGTIFNGIDVRKGGYGYGYGYGYG
ncbi:MAG: polysaccharide biosynthesis tyrosine autokinase, partial [Gammaproteobacteria bacterium]|nr:polysaccharide biosynthesis tyrosine autokinase [Gammaproteobacteria bacterium]